MMSTNQMLMLAIVILSSLIAVVALYYLVLFLINKKREKKVDDIFNPSNLVEEESLMNVMDEKKNVEFKKTQGNEEQFVENNSDVKIVTSQALTQEEKVNPFGVDMTMHKKEDGTKIEIQDPNNKNKFIK